MQIKKWLRPAAFIAILVSGIITWVTDGPNVLTILAMALSAVCLCLEAVEVIQRRRKGGKKC